MPEIEDKLRVILSLVDDSVKFAEAKHAGVVVLSTAVIAAILSYLTSPAKLSAAWRSLLFGCIAILVVSILISLYSFLPRNNPDKLLKPHKRWMSPDDSDILYYFGHLCKYTPSDLAEKIINLYTVVEDKQISIGREQIDIASQIIANSRVAVYKFELFKATLICIVVAVCIVLSGLITQLAAFLVQ